MGHFPSLGFSFFGLSLASPCPQVPVASGEVELAWGSERAPGGADFYA